MTTPLLDIRDLHAGYGKAEVLHGIDLHADAGQVITVIGPNGAGKTTLLNTLMGLLPTRGQMFYRGEDISDYTLEERVMLGIALVPEKRELFSTMTVEDNLELGGFRQMRSGNLQWRSRMDDVYDIFPRLKERRLQEAGTLSGGERNRVHLAKLLRQGSNVLLLDEPFGGLSPAETDLMAKSIIRLHKGGRFGRLHSEGPAMIIIEHKLQQLMKIADRILVIAQAFRYGLTVEEIAQASKYEPWFLRQIEQLVAIEASVRKDGLPKDAKERVDVGQVVASGVNLARELSNEPANVIYPESFVARCKPLTDLGVEIEVLDEAAMAALGARLPKDAVAR